jgi:hypothetical protein
MWRCSEKKSAYRIVAAQGYRPFTALLLARELKYAAISGGKHNFVLQRKK